MFISNKFIKRWIGTFFNNFFSIRGLECNLFKKGRAIAVEEHKRAKWKSFPYFGICVSHSEHADRESVLRVEALSPFRAHSPAFHIISSRVDGCGDGGYVCVFDSEEILSAAKTANSLARLSMSWSNYATQISWKSGQSFKCKQKMEFSHIW
jgi:hypothetical protein